MHLGLLLNDIGRDSLIELFGEANLTEKNGRGIRALPCSRQARTGQARGTGATTVAATTDALLRIPILPDDQQTAFEKFALQAAQYRIRAAALRHLASFDLPVSAAP